MELKVENPMWVKPQSFAGEAYSSDRVYAEANLEDAESATLESYGVCERSRSFRTVEMDGIPFSDRVEERMGWLRSQIIGGEAEIDSPFGERRLCYADHTASGRSLRYIEDFILRKLLPFYGNTHTCDSYVGHHTTKMVNDATTYIKRCLGGGEEEAILFCGQGTTSAIKRLQEVMGIAVPSILRERVIETLKEEERWVVFVGPYEHHSNLLSWRQSLAEVVEIGMDENGLLDFEMLRSQLEACKKALHGPFVAALLSDLFGVQARGGCSCAGPYGHKLLNIDEACSQAYRTGWTRVSFPYYMSNEEFEFILKALEFIADYGQRFLPLYAFNLRNGSWTLKEKELTDLLGKENYSASHIFSPSSLLRESFTRILNPLY